MNDTAATGITIAGYNLTMLSIDNFVHNDMSLILSIITSCLFIYNHLQIIKKNHNNKN
jgi:hypothetical protein